MPKVSQVLKVMPVRRDHRVLLVLKVSQVLKVTQALKVLKVR